MSTRGAVIAGAVASALWLSLGGLYAALVWFAVVPVDALRLVIPEVVPARAWYRDAPWMVVLPLLAALLFGALVTLAAQVVSRLSAGSSRALVFAAVWLGAIVAAVLLVATVAGGALARAADGILPPDLTQPVPEVLPPVTPPASSVEAPVPPGADWCTAEELGVRVAGGDAATGHRVAVVAVTPLFDEPCVLPGYPDIAFADAAGSDLSTPVSPGGGFMSEDPGPANLLLMPGEEAATWITWDAVAAGPGEIGTIWIAPWPGATRAILAFDHGTDIGNGAAVAVTAWQPYTTDAFAP